LNLEPASAEDRGVSLDISPENLSFIGEGLKRPECVLTVRDGTVFTADWDGGVTRIARDGSQQRLLARASFGLRPNGIALRRDGSFLVAHLGTEGGGLFQLFRDGALKPLLLEVEGAAIPPSNYVLEDSQSRIWLTVSTRLQPRDLGYRKDVANGFIILLDEKGARVVADNLGYTNEVQFDANEEYLYVNETFSRRLSRFRVDRNGHLSAKEVVAEFGEGTFPDGLTFDAEEGIWITSIVSNRVIRVGPGGRQQILLEDSDPDHLNWVETAYQDGRLGRPHLDGVKSRVLKNISSLAFGGPDLKTVYLGCLLDDRIARFRSPIAGRRPLHWDFPS